MSYAAKLKDLIASRKARVGVIGMGYVGYPMAQLAASSGFTVVGIDLEQGKVDQVNQGISYIQDVPTSSVKPLVEAGRLSASTEYSALKDVDAVMIAVPTPLNKTGDPDMQFVVGALESLKPYLHHGMLISLESTTYPGTTDELFVPAIESAGFKVEEDVFVSFSPERVDPGNPVYQTKNTPKVVGGVGAVSTEVATAFYGAIIDHVVPVSSTVAAEMVKLYENTFRAINIGLVNELAIICHLLKVDVWEIIDAAKTKPFGFMPFYPGPGLGGHCIPVDPSYLAWKMKALRYKTRFIDLATEVNTGMPVWTVTRAMEILNENQKSVKGSKVLLMGMAYKADIDDLRESPAFDVYELLERHGAHVSFHDPHCTHIRFEHGVQESKPLTKELLESQDLVIITTGHKKVDYKLVLEHSKTVFDTRNVTRTIREGVKSKVHYL